MEQEKKFQVDERKKEKIMFQSHMLHYGLYMPRQEAYFFGDIPWHWHDEFEFGYLLGGSMLYRTSHQEVVLHKGEGIFINSGVLHSLHPLEPTDEVRLQSQFFDKAFLAGAFGNILDIRYVAPVQEKKQFDAMPLYRSDETGRTVLEKLEQAAALCLKGERFFELRLRSLISQLWEEIYLWAMDEKEEPFYNTLEDERIKKMLSYMQKHYAEKITVADLAGVIPISERECHRLFQHNLGTTPVELMISLRLQRAQELLMYTDKSVLEIAMETGFGNSSYFGKLFKRYHHITPKQYRNVLFLHAPHASASQVSQQDGTV